jgi:putative ABC transport system permease protein
MTRQPLSLFLALRELRSDWQSSLCFVAALIGILAPLLIILSLKNGVIGNMVGRLIDDPSNRELISVGAGRHDEIFFRTLAERSDVAFVIPRTRSINTSADAIRNQSERKLERSVPLIPTGDGDPLLSVGARVEPGQVYITQELAERLHLGATDTLEMLIQRSVDGQIETGRGDFDIVGIVPKETFAQMAVFIALQDLLAVERFRDNPDLGVDEWQTSGELPETYASFRLYVSQLDDLDDVQDSLEKQGVLARPRAQNVSLLLGFKNNLNILYTVVAALAISGFWAAMAANLRGMVERQRVSFSLLDLIGMPQSARRTIPILQSVVLVLTGIVITLALVMPALALINQFFSKSGSGPVAYLGFWDVMATLLLGLITALTASIWAVRAVNDIFPDEVLRHA